MSISWTSASDWDSRTSQSGVVHSNYGDYNAGSVCRGYDLSIFPNLVAFYPMHEGSGSTCNDVKNNRDGTYRGSPSYNQSGILNASSVSFSGNDYVDLGSTLTGYLTNRHTIGGWADLSDPSNRGAIIGTNTSSGGNGTHMMFYDWNGNGRINLWGNGTGNFTNGTSDVRSGGWRFIVWTWDGSTHRIYVDASQETSSSRSSSPSSSEHIYIGQEYDNSSTSDFINGRLCNWFFASSVYSGSKIQQLYEVFTNGGSLTTDWRSP